MNIPAPGATGALHDQPHLFVERDGVHYTLLGTAHVSRASVDAVLAAIDSGAYDTIAVELDPHRLASLTDPDAMALRVEFDRDGVVVAPGDFGFHRVDAGA